MRTREAKAPKTAKGAMKPKIADESILSAPTWETANSNEEKLLKDDAVNYTHTLLNSMVTCAGWGIVGKDSKRLGRIVEESLSKPGFDAAVKAITGTVFTRFACVEILWEYQPPYLLPSKYRAHEREDVRAETDDKGDIANVKIYTDAGEQDLPLERRLFARYLPTFRQKLGQTVLTFIKERITQKQDTDEALTEFIKLFASPMVIGKHPETWNKNQKNDLLEKLKKGKRTGYFVIPATALIELSEAKGNSGVSIAMQKLREDEFRIARAVLGAVLAFFEAQFGTRAQSDTHLEVVRQVIRSYQKFIEEIINAQLLPLLMRFNLPPKALYDLKFELNEPNMQMIKDWASAISDLAMSGILNEDDKAAVRDQALPMIGIKTEDSLPETADMAAGG